MTAEPVARQPLPAQADLLARAALLDAARRLREEGETDAALAVLDRLQARDPAFSAQFHERGACHIQRGDAAAALAALYQAVRRNPALVAGWDMIARLHRQLGQTAPARDAAAQQALLQRLPPALVKAASLHADGDLAQAEAVITPLLRAQPAHPLARRLLARLWLDSGRAAEAAAVLAQVLADLPDFHAARADFAMALLQAQQPLAARDEAARLLAHDGANHAWQKLHAAASLALGDHEAVIAGYGALLADPALAAPDRAAERAELATWQATAFKTVGNAAAALAGYRAALQAKPDHGAAWYGLANLKTGALGPGDAARLRAVLADPHLHSHDRIYACFALGQALEDAGAVADAWASYAKGNALAHARTAYCADTARACAQRLAQTFAAPFLAARAGWGLDDPAPIFIVGLPRSGSTLVEQILASHPAVEGTHELPELGRLVTQSCGRDPACGLPHDWAALARIDRAGARALGERYVAATRAYRRTGRPRFIDKMPDNFWYAGLIAMILPRATIIDVRRAPMACCFSNFKQLFGPASQEYSYAPETLGAHYRIYLAVMRHWDAVMPGRVLRLCHEDLVADLPGSVARLLDHCGLPFDPVCLRYFATQRSVRTPSAQQVRRPIDPATTQAWQRFAPWLGPLRAALGDALHDWKD